MENTYSIRKVGRGYGFFVNGKLVYKAKSVKQLEPLIKDWLMANQS